MKTLMILLLSCSLLGTACKNQKPMDSPKEESVKPTEPRKMDTSFDAEAFDKSVPDACTLVSPSFIAKTFGIDATAVTIKDGSNIQNTKARSCFFKWETSLPNSGILLQALKNPVEEEFPNYIVGYIKTKKEKGEKSFTDPGVVYSYSDWPVAGDEGAASAESGKYYWRIGSEMAFMIAFNLPIDPAQQEQAAAALAKEMMSNL